MSTSAPVRETRPMPVPPDEEFWQRYSPHNEAPLSGVSSTVIHVLILCLILLVVWVQKILKVDEETKNAPVEVVRFKLDGGGGGSPTGDGKGPAGRGDPGDIVGEDLQGDLPEGDPNRKEREPPKEHQPLDLSKAPPLRQEFTNDKTVDQLIQRSTEQWGSLTKLEGEARNKLRKAVNPGAGSGRGQGGSGSDGGRDTGKDPGQGGGMGEGKGNLNQREKRVLRWAMTFNTRDGKDYLNQLVGLKAMIAIPIDDKGRFQLIRDLKNPGAAKEEDVSSLNRIYWIDDKPESIQSLFSALGGKQPPYFAAFFPEELEKKLLRLELAHAEKHYRTRNEDRIHETKFDVIGSPSEGYDVRVREVYLKR